MSRTLVDRLKDLVVDMKGSERNLQVEAEALASKSKEALAKAFACKEVRERIEDILAQASQEPPL